MFLLLGCGWTITYTDLLEKENYLFIGGFGLVVNAIIGLCTYLDNGMEHQFHDFSGWPGVLLLVTRLFMYLFFTAQCVKTGNQVPKKIKPFFNKMIFAGTIYFLSFPAIYFISFIADPYVRHRFFVFGNYISTLYATVLLLRQLTK